MIHLAAIHIIGAIALFVYVLREAPSALLTLRGAAWTFLGCACWEALIFWSMVRQLRGNA